MELKVRTLAEGSRCLQVDPEQSFNDLLAALATGGPSHEPLLLASESPRIVHGASLVDRGAAVGTTCKPGDTLVLLAKPPVPARRARVTTPDPSLVEIMEATLAAAPPGGVPPAEEAPPPRPRPQIGDLGMLLQGLMESENVMDALHAALLAAGDEAAAAMGTAGVGAVQLEALQRAAHRHVRSRMHHSLAGYYSEDSLEEEEEEEEGEDESEQEEEESSVEEEEEDGEAAPRPEDIAATVAAMYGLGPEAWGLAGEGGEEEEGESGSEGGRSPEEEASGTARGGGGLPAWAPPPDPAALAELTAMGFSSGAATNALLLRRNRLEAAVEWLLENGADPDAARPLTSRQLYRLYHPRRNAIAVNGGLLSALESMGFDRALAAEALAASRNSLPGACQWLVHHSGTRGAGPSGSGGGAAALRAAPAPGSDGGSRPGLHSNSADDEEEQGSPVPAHGGSGAGGGGSAAGSGSQDDEGTPGFLPPFGSGRGGLGSEAQGDADSTPDLEGASAHGE